MRFIDQARISVIAGHGGHGCVSFRREKFIPKGGPDGGDGGRGGSVIIKARARLLTLYDLRVKRRYQAENGRSGEGRQRFGRAGNDLIIEVPVGTMIYLVRDDTPLPDNAPSTDGLPCGCEDEAPTLIQGRGGETVLLYEASGADSEEYEDTHDGEADDDGQPSEPLLLADLDHDDAELVAARGGRGGKGNTHFKSSTMRTPRFAQPGEPGEAKVLKLELKILADGGIIGLPNAGKSTFIAAICAARPKIADYPFTTLSPNLGVLSNDLGQRLVVADIPGLIEGAHLGHGLGHQFLRHVERTSFLVHILSAQNLDQDDPWRGFEVVNAELEAFNPELARKPQLSVVNKIDLLSPDALELLRRRAEQENKRIFFISALLGFGLKPLVDEMWRMRQGR
jgi:GTPase